MFSKLMSFLSRNKSKFGWLAKAIAGAAYYTGHTEVAAGALYLGGLLVGGGSIPTDAEAAKSQSQSQPG